ncbi:MAG TPA: DUF3667 domain-containing protein [Longimicrobium sp.]|jgi:hypothetical protein
MPDPPVPSGSAVADRPGARGDPTAAPKRKARWWSPETRRTPARPCLNCGDPTVSAFCPTCGQRKVEVRISLRRMLLELLEDQLALNATLPRTVGALLFRPGHLTSEYVKGRIVRYVPPFRLYLVTSVLFFVLLPLAADANIIADQVARDDAAQVRRVSAPAAANPGGLPAPPPPPARPREEMDINIAWKDTAAVPGWLKPLNRRLTRTGERLKRMPPGEALRALIVAMEENAPKGVFLMMPLFAFFLKVLYFRQRRYFVEHFVFALHVHSLAFVLSTVGMLFQFPLLLGTLGLWQLVYVFVAMKRVYGQGIVRTFAKYLALGFAYVVFGVGLGAAATMLLAAITM